MFKKYFSTIMMTIAFLLFVVMNGLFLRPISNDAAELLINLCFIWPIWIVVMALKEAEIDALWEWRKNVLAIINKGDDAYGKD